MYIFQIYYSYLCIDGNFLNMLPRHLMNTSDDGKEKRLEYQHCYVLLH